MRESVLQRLCCAECRGSLEWYIFGEPLNGVLTDGVVWCVACRRWYPLDDELLELLPATLAYSADRERFWRTHETQLRKLNLLPDVVAPDVTAVQLQRKQQEHFDWYASNEEQTYSSYEQMPFWRAVDDKTFGRWRREIRPDTWLLDVGCAQGRSSARLMDLPINLVGFDISKALVRQAIDGFRKGTNKAKATFLVADGAHFPIRDAAFDYVLIYGVLHHLPDPAATCREVARVLRPGGTYFGSENNASMFRAVFDLLMKLNPIWHEEAGAQPLISERELREWFNERDFDIRCETQVFVPPHLANLFGRRLGAVVVNVSDRIGSMVPVIRNNGGLLLARVQRRSSAGV